MAKSKEEREREARSAAASLMGRRGGNARRDAMTAEERKASAKKAALARWGAKKKGVKKAEKKPE